MGDLRPGDGGSLPEFPPEWGTIVIPDDPSELHEESMALRRELRRDSRRARLRSLLGLSRDGQSLGVPVIVMAVALVTTLLSLFVVTLDRPTTTPPGATTIPTTTPLADVTLTDEDNNRVRLGGLLPAILLLADDCDCAALLTAIAAATPAPITIVPIGRSVPCPAGTTPSNMRCLADPQGTVLARYPTPNATTTTAGPSAPGTPGTTGTAGNGDASSTGPAAPSASAEPVSVPAVLVDSTGTPTGPFQVSSPADLTDAFSRLAR